MRLDLPRELTWDGLDELLAPLVTSLTAPPEASRVEIHFGTLRFVEPVGVTVLANTVEWLRLHGVDPELVVPPETEDADPIRYLDDAGFFERYLGYRLSGKSSLRPTTRPLSFIKPAASYDWIQNKLLTWLAGSLDVPPGALGLVGIGLGEVFNNVRDHSGVQGGCVFAQHYPTQRRVHIAVSDFGVGIPTTIRRKLPDLDDASAILKATEEGYSTYSVPNNLGAGLHSILTQVALANGGTVRIWSGNGVLDASSPDGHVVRTPSTGSTVYPGTLLQLEFRTDTFDAEDDDDTLDWL